MPNKVGLCSSVFNVLEGPAIVEVLCGHETVLNLSRRTKERSCPQNPGPNLHGKGLVWPLRVVPLRRGRAQGFAGCQKSSQPSPGPLPANLRCHLSRLGCALGAAATWFQSPEPWSKGWSACGANAKALTITDKVIASCYIYVKYIFITISYTYIYIYLEERSLRLL